MMVEASATPGFVVPVFRHAQVDALAVVRKPFTETVGGQNRGTHSPFNFRSHKQNRLLQRYSVASGRRAGQADLWQEALK